MFKAPGWRMLAGALFFMKKFSKVLLLTVAYGQGHRSAAAALAEEFALRGSKVRVVDPFDADTSGLYALTKSYYTLCVRRAPWLWGVTYSQTDTADWSTKATWPGIRNATRELEDILVSWRPDVVVCTYPLLGYMMDYLRESKCCKVPYVVVVTDALEISKPWLKTRTPLLFVPDEYSQELICEQHGLSHSVVHACGFPVSRKFRKVVQKSLPSRQRINVLYGAYLSTHRTLHQVHQLLQTFPGIHLVVLAGNRARVIRRFFKSAIASGRLRVEEYTTCMEEELAQAHLYIGKTGAATMFEAYAAGVPVIANFALPGQEQGNLELLLRDAAGCSATSARELCRVIEQLLENDSAGWQKLRHNMLSKSHRAAGAVAIADKMIQHFLS